MVSICWAFVFVSHKAKGFLSFLLLFFRRKNCRLSIRPQSLAIAAAELTEAILRRATPTKSGLFGLK